MELVFGLLGGGGSVILFLVARHQHAKLFVRKKVAASPAQSAGIRDAGFFCTCGHLSNMHGVKGKCMAEIPRTAHSYSTECKCQRYTGPMGLAELELWGPKELRPTPEPVPTTEIVLHRPPPPTGNEVVDELHARIARLQNAVERQERAMLTSPRYEVDWAGDYELVEDDV